jgi:branched-chain amino acid transport system permease protein
VPPAVSSDLSFAAELLASGLLVGVLYAMVALGFVLIYKASDIFNFAQGAMTFFAALALVSVLPVAGWVPALVFVVLLMFAVALAIERLALRPLVGQPPLSLAMATIGITFVLGGLAQAIWGTQPKRLPLGVVTKPIEVAGILVNQTDLLAAGLVALLVAGLVWFFQRTKIGLGLRAVADDHEAALSVGIPLRRVWAVAWGLSGVVAIVAGILWGNRLGVGFAISQIALKALPVLIIGGIDSIPGAIAGGLIVGASESLAEGFIGPLVGGGVQDIFAYLVALVFLIVRPYGLFGRPVIERV